MKRPSFLILTLLGLTHTVMGWSTMSYASGVASAGGSGHKGLLGKKLQTQYKKAANCEMVSVKKSNALILHFYQSFDSQSRLLYIPALNQKRPEGFLFDLCSRGISVATFETNSKKLRARASEILYQKLATAKQPRPIFIFAAGDGAKTALSLVGRHARVSAEKVKSVILDNPALETMDLTGLNGFPNRVVVFSCAARAHKWTSLKKGVLVSQPQVLSPINGQTVSCDSPTSLQHAVATSVSESVESQTAAEFTANWFWKQQAL